MALNGLESTSFSKKLGPWDSTDALERAGEAKRKFGVRRMCPALMLFYNFSFHRDKSINDVSLTEEERSRHYGRDAIRQYSPIALSQRVPVR